MKCLLVGLLLLAASIAFRWPRRLWAWLPPDPPRWWEVMHREMLEAEIQRRSQEAADLQARRDTLARHNQRAGKVER